MKYLVAALLMVAVLGAATVHKVKMPVTPSVEKTFISGNAQMRYQLRSDQPDTLLYDDGIPAWGYDASNLYGAVRFTAPAPFELRSIYFWLLHTSGQGCTDSFYVTVYDTLDGNILWGPYGFVEDSGEFWIFQIDLDSTEYLNFNPGEDFYVVIGPQVAWGVYTLVFDQATVDPRSYTWMPGDTAWALEEGGDMMIRAGGELGDFVDLQSICTFNDQHKFFITDDGTITLKAYVTNRGNLSSTFDQYFFIRDDSGNVYFTDVVSGTANPGDTIELTATAPWSDTAGYYIAYDSVVATGANPDLILGNNTSTAEIRIYDEEIGNWFMYTDWSAEACFSWVVGNKWCVGYMPDCYSVTVDTIAFAFGVSPDTIAIDVPFEVWWGMSSPEVLVAAGTIDTVFDGYIHLIYFTDTLGNPSGIPMDSGMIFIAYPFYQDPNGNRVCLYQDQSQPIASINQCMMPTSFMQFAGDSVWNIDLSGDWFMWAWISACTPPSGPQYVRGDANADGAVNVTDAVFSLGHLFPPQFACQRAADASADDALNVSDVLYLLGHLFPLTIPAPRFCGDVDSFNVSLPCDSFPPCGYPLKAKSSSEGKASMILGEPEYEGGDVVIPVYVESEEEIAGIQLELSYEGDYSVRVETEGCVTEDFDYFRSYVDAGEVAFVGVYSLTPAVKGDEVAGIEAGRHRVAEIVVRGGELPEFKVEEAVLASRDGRSIEPEVMLGVNEGARRKPRAFALFQNIPNPFSGNTVIKYALPRDVDVELTIYNIAGQRVRTLVNGMQRAGYKAIEWDGRDDSGRRVAPGVYFYKMKAGEFKATRKLTLLR